MIKQQFDRNSKEYWDRIYSEELASGKLRQAPELMEKVLPLLCGRTEILDFGSGPGGNIHLLSQQISGAHFTLVDHSPAALEYAHTQLLGTQDDRGNTFSYYQNLDDCPGIYKTILSFQVLEHLTDFATVLHKLWSKLEVGGTLLISVPVKGKHDHNREHINKFTVDSMLGYLWQFTPWVSVSTRTFSTKHKKLATAFFMTEKQ